MKRADVEEMFARLQARDPHPETELIYNNPFELLVAVVLSAQATDVGVNKATPVCSRWRIRRKRWLLCRRPRSATR